MGDIEKTQPIRRLQFAGAAQPVAACVHRRLGGKLREDPGGTFVIYDSAKKMHAEGLTHYAITVGANAPSRGFAEWRILTPPSARRGDRDSRWAGVTETAVGAYWKPVEDCASAAKTP